MKRLVAALVAAGGAASAGCHSTLEIPPGVYVSSAKLYSWQSRPLHPFAASDRGFLDAVRANGAADFHCPSDQVTSHRIEANIFSAAGCGKRMQYRAAPVLSIPPAEMLPGVDARGAWQLEHFIGATDGTFFPNSPVGWLDAARASAAHDLHCTEPIAAQQLQFSRSSASFLADGCGKRAAYQSDLLWLFLVSIVPADPSPVP